MLAKIIRRTGSAALRRRFAVAQHHDHHDDHHDDHHHHEVKLDLDRVLLDTSKEALRYRSIFGLHSEGHVNEKPEPSLSYEEEYWYLAKDGLKTLDNMIWGDAHFTPYQYDKYCNVPAGYLIPEDPLDERDLYDYKFQLLISFAMFLTIAIFFWGTTSLFTGSHGRKLFYDYLTVHQIEDGIRRIRIENKLLEDELAALQQQE